MKEFLFSYGTLQQQDVQVKLFGRTLKGAIDHLRNYRATAIEIGDAAFLTNGGEKYQRIAVYSGDDKDIIEGTVLEVTAAELLVADKYEPEEYKRVKVRMDSGIQAWMYAAM